MMYDELLMFIDVRLVFCELPLGTFSARDTVCSSSISLQKIFEFGGNVHV